MNTLTPDRLQECAKLIRKVRHTLATFDEDNVLGYVFFSSSATCELFNQLAQSIHLAASSILLLSKKTSEPLKGPVMESTGELNLANIHIILKMSKDALVYLDDLYEESLYGLSSVDEDALDSYSSDVDVIYSSCIGILEFLKNAMEGKPSVK